MFHHVEENNSSNSFPKVLVTMYTFLFEIIKHVSGSATLPKKKPLPWCNEEDKGNKKETNNKIQQ